MEKESYRQNFQDNIAYWLEELTQRVSATVAEVTLPYSFGWRDIEFLRTIQTAEGGVPLTRILYPEAASGLDSKAGQELFQLFKDAGFLDVRHSDDGPVMVELNELGIEFVESRHGAYQELHKRFSHAVSEEFLQDLKALWKVLHEKEVKA